MEHTARRLLSCISGLLLAGTMTITGPVFASTGSSGSSRGQHIRETVTARATQEAHQKSKNFNADAIAAIKQAG